MVHVLTVSETARLLRRHPTAIRRMLRSGELGGVVRRGGGWVIVASIERLLGEPLHLTNGPGEIERAPTRASWSPEESGPATADELEETP